MIFKLLLDCSEIRVFVKDKKKDKILWNFMENLILNEIKWNKTFWFFFLIWFLLKNLWCS